MRLLYNIPSLTSRFARGLILISASSSFLFCLSIHPCLGLLVLPLSRFMVPLNLCFALGLKLLSGLCLVLVFAVQSRLLSHPFGGGFHCGTLFSVSR